MYQEIIDFWFGEIDESRWWIKDEGFDELIIKRFGGIHEKVIRGDLKSWRTLSLGSLAEIIVLDQFSRNMFRNDAKSFAYDSIALSLAQEAVKKGFDLELSPKMRSFIYLPFMHSESLDIHNEAIVLFEKLGDQMKIDFELQHKIIIERFGRYPHRNSILGRTSTMEEKAFLQTTGSTF